MSEIGHRVLGNTDIMVKANELIQLLWVRLVTTHRRQKGYAETRFLDLDIQAGDYNMLVVSPR